MLNFLQTLNCEKCKYYDLCIQLDLEKCDFKTFEKFILKLKKGE